MIGERLSARDIGAFAVVRLFTAISGKWWVCSVVDGTALRGIFDSCMVVASTESGDWGGKKFTPWPCCPARGEWGVFKVFALAAKWSLLCRGRLMFINDRIFECQPAWHIVFFVDTQRSVRIGSLA